MNAVKTKFKIISVITLLFLCNVINAQQLPGQSIIEDHLTKYDDQLPQNILFAHFDKTVYVPNEDVWFTAYLLKSSVAANAHKVLAATLVNDDSHLIYLECKFPMIDARAFGHFIVPDTVQPGRYHIQLITDLKTSKGFPAAFFQQAVTIKTTGVKTFGTVYNWMGDTTSKRLQAILNVIGDPKKTRSAIVQILQGKNSIKIKKSANGDFAIPVNRESLPVAENAVHLKINVNGDIQYVNIPIPKINAAPVIKFYPEGGYLISNLPNTVGWECKTAAGAPVRVKAILLKDNQPVDTIQTSSNGLGHFRIMPEKGAVYSVKTLGTSAGGATFPLPQAVATGIVLNVTRPVIADTLIVYIRTDEKKEVFLVAHNYRDLLAFQKLKLSDGKNTIKIALNAAPAGLLTLTLLDTRGMPLAERLCFVHFDKIKVPLVGVNTDKPTYHPREKVTLKISSDSLKNLGNISIACVQQNRIESQDLNNIKDYFYVQEPLANVNPSILGTVTGDEKYLEDVLLVKGWRRYSWLAMMKDGQPGPDTLSNLEFTGNVVKGKSPLKKPVNVILMNHGDPSAVQTTLAGNFTIPVTTLFVVPEDRIDMLVEGNDPEDYNITIKDPFKSIEQAGASSVIGINGTFINYDQDQDFNLKGLDKNRLLKEVKIRSSRGDLINGTQGVSADNCSDYVCLYGILNCTNHPTGRKPYIGESVVYEGQRITYNACLIPDRFRKERPITFINGINLPKDFYPIDAAENAVNMPHLLSILYWNYYLPLTSQKPTELSFYTGDVKGRFEVIIQGVTQKGLVFNKTEFEVN